MLRGFRSPSARLGGKGVAGALALASAGVCAAATLVAALVAAEAAPLPSQRGSATSGAAPEPTAGAALAAGSTGVWDPTLGGFRDPTGEELSRMSRGFLRVGAERPQVELRADGSMLLRVPEAGFGATWGHLRPEGTAEMRCAHSGPGDEAPASHPTASEEER